MFRLFYVLLILLISKVTIAQKNFSISGNAIRHTITANVNGNTVLYIGELDGSLSCYTLNGQKIWRKQTTNPAVLFEIEAADINNNGNDELIAVSGNGNVYCYDSVGRQLWKYTPNHKVRFSEVAVVKNNKNVQIFVGGNDYYLYELNADGALKSKTKISGVVRKIAVGNFISANKQSLFVMTLAKDKYGWDYMGIMDPETKKTIAQAPKKGLSFGKAVMITDIVIADIDKNRKDDILFFGDTAWKPIFIGLNSDFKVIAKFEGTRKQLQRYGHARGAFNSKKNEIIFQYGSMMFVLDKKGELKATGGERYKGEFVFSDITYHGGTNQLIAAGEVDGGNSVYFYDLKKSSWINTVQKKQGRMVEVKFNLKKLYEQALNFKMPSYQQPSKKEWVMITSKTPSSKVTRLKGGEVKFVIQTSPREGTSRSKLVAKIGEKALKKDRRGKYKDSRADIVQMAKDFESKNQPFTFWAGHGNDPFYVQIETLEKVLEVAPNTCYGFVYAEMDNVNDPRIIHFVNEYIPRLAKAIRKHNKAKLYLRYKNMFWSATSHLPLWKDLFFSGKYSDFLVPASEDTSNRTQDLNLAGRVGMFAGGYVNDFAMRLVDDNPTSWRPLSPGGQKSISPYLRQGVMMAAYGAHYGVIINNSFTEEPGLNILFALMGSGVLPLVERENIESIGSWHLIKEVDEELIHSVDHHHNLKSYKSDDDNAVFSVAQMNWAGTSIPNHDFSKLAMGVNYRWLNYIPELPYGMVPIGPVEYQKTLEEKYIPFSVSNAKHGYRGDLKVPANQFANNISQSLNVGKKNLNVTVKGAAWSAVKIDASHTRIILMDQGYIDPQNRNATISFSHRQPKSAKDILSNENIEINNNLSKVIVPAGSLRFIDVTY